MLDLKVLREEINSVREGIAKKKFQCDLDAFLAIDAKKRDALTQSEAARAEQNAANEQIASLKKGSPEFLKAVEAMKECAAKAKELEIVSREIEQEWKAQYMAIPNIPHASAPVGKTDKDNITIATWGDVNGVSPDAIPHYDIPWFQKYVDFPRGVKVTGGGFPFYIGDMARLVRALLSFFLDEAHKAGYQEFLPPIVVNPASATATGQLPDKEGQMYHSPTDDLYLIPTAEVPVTNFFRDEILEESDLPLKRCAYTPCFRREAGSWGKDVRGLNRLHQFDKVELVKWTHPDNSLEELELLRQDAERLLQKLNIPYRVLAICTGDMGFPHSKQYDLEVWAAGQGRWLEVSSCSNFTDFQARRAGIRYRPKMGGKAQVVHTLNGSALAVPRVLAAILENNFNCNGLVRVPEVLRKWIDVEYIGDEIVCESCKGH